MCKSSKQSQTHQSNRDVGKRCLKMRHSLGHLSDNGSSFLEPELRPEIVRVYLATWRSHGSVLLRSNVGGIIVGSSFVPGHLWLPRHAWKDRRACHGVYTGRRGGDVESR